MKAEAATLVVPLFIVFPPSRLVRLYVMLLLGMVKRCIRTTTTALSEACSQSSSLLLEWKEFTGELGSKS